MIKSMTAFARCDKQNDWGSVVWEIRAVNHRFLDVGFKLPDIFKSLEMELREILRSYMRRGHIDCYLQYKTSHIGYNTLSVNTDLVQALGAACAEIKKSLPEASANLNALNVLSWPGVLQGNDENLSEIKSSVLELFKQALMVLNENREREGQALTQLLLTKSQEIAKNVQEIKQRVPVICDSQREKILARLHDIQGELDSSRLEQELVYFAQKIDISEEIDRLATHVQEMQNILQSNKNEAIGKRLDFLLQEFNRETNTIASKSVDTLISKLAVEMKVIIEQMREQVQNIE
jgi:uncharacterized protein (TIGR00255 family)